jgi:hypothetical protein
MLIDENGELQDDIDMESPTEIVSKDLDAGDIFKCNICSSTSTLNAAEGFKALKGGLDSHRHH